MMARSDQQQKLNLGQDVARVIDLLEKLQRTEYNAWLGKDVSVEKLRQLHKVLRSDFFSTVRQVYERVYETVDIHGSPDIRANACAKATVAVFAASDSATTQARLVQLPKTEEGLGFNIMGGKEQASPIYISRIIPGGVADRHGDLRRGDQLLAINGVSVEGESHERAVELLKAASNHVLLLVRHTPRILEEMESRYDQARSQRPRHVK